MPKAKTDPGDEQLDERRREVDDGEVLHRDLRPVEVDRPRQPQATFALRLPPEDVAEIRRLASERGLGPTQLVRSWLVERLHAERSHRPLLMRGEPLDDVTIEKIVHQLRPALNDLIRESAKTARTGRLEQAPDLSDAQSVPGKAEARTAKAATTRKESASAKKSRVRKS